MKNPVKFLELALTEWAFVVSQPALCRHFILAGKVAGDDFIADMIRALLCHGGDWLAASYWMDINRPDYFGRVTKFRRWAEKITAPRKRGLLLEWKGGAL